MTIFELYVQTCLMLIMPAFIVIAWFMVIHIYREFIKTPENTNKN